MPHVINFSWLPLKPDSKDSEEAKKLHELNKSVKGLKSCYWGFLLEHPDSVESVSEFDSVDSLNAYLASPLNAEITRLTAGLVDTSVPNLKPYQGHSLMSGPLAPVADAPVTRLVSLVVKASTNEAAFAAAVDKMRTAAQDTKPAGFRAVTYGWAAGTVKDWVDPRGDGSSKGEVRFYGLFTGWDSKEQAEAGSEIMKGLAKELLEPLGLLATKVAHLELNKIQV
jgi:hypothetical protein